VVLVAEVLVAVVLEEAGKTIIFTVRMKNSVLTFVIFATFWPAAFLGQQIQTVAFYNLENLFDTINGPNEDDEFLPEALSNWNSEKYWQKIAHIQQVMTTLQLPMLMGVCEVENRAVLQDVIGADKRYAIVHTESPDARGIDVGLLYRQDLLKLKSYGQLRFVLPGDTIPTSRDILWAQFKYKKEIIYVMINQWRSRRAGTEQSEPRQIMASNNAKQYIDSIQQHTPKAKIIFMGDLNDYPEDKAPRQISSVLSPQITAESGEFGGSYNYKNEWGILDHIMVSENALSGKFQVQTQSGKIHSEPFLLSEYKGQVVPNRTYAGSKYLGGYSDHLPVSIQVILQP